MVKQLYAMKQDQVRLFEYNNRLLFACFFFVSLETGSIIDSHDVNYLNDLHYQQHQRGRRRIESASDMDDQSLYSDDVIPRYRISIFFHLYFLNRFDQHHRFILLNHVG